MIFDRLSKDYNEGHHHPQIKVQRIEKAENLKKDVVILKGVIFCQMSKKSSILEKFQKGFETSNSETSVNKPGWVNDSRTKKIWLDIISSQESGLDRKYPKQLFNLTKMDVVYFGNDLMAKKGKSSMAQKSRNSGKNSIAGNSVKTNTYSECTFYSWLWLADAILKSPTAPYSFLTVLKKENQTYKSLGKIGKLQMNENDIHTSISIPEKITGNTISQPQIIFVDSNVLTDKQAMNRMIVDTHHGLDNGVFLKAKKETVNNDVNSSGNEKSTIEHLTQYIGIIMVGCILVISMFGTIISTLVKKPFTIIVNAYASFFQNNEGNQNVEAQSLTVQIPPAAQQSLTQTRQQSMHQSNRKLSNIQQLFKQQLKTGLNSNQQTSSSSRIPADQQTLQASSSYPSKPQDRRQSRSCSNLDMKILALNEQFRRDDYTQDANLTIPRNMVFSRTQHEDAEHNVYGNSTTRFELC